VLEIVYLGILHNFGIVGLGAYLLAMAGPLLLYAARVLPFASTEYKRSLAAGLVIYLVVSMSDGALLFIPVMVFFWFVASLLLSDNPSFRALEPPAGGDVRAPAAA
jgi:O-antigen ligase